MHLFQIMGLIPLFAAIAAVAALYALHRLGLYLESRGLIYYWHKKPSGGSAYNPLQEIYQPQIRHVIGVREQRFDEDANDEGAPECPGGRNPRTPPAA
jgi:hypothetical protein